MSAPEDGQIVDVLPSEHCDATSARAFFERAVTSTEVTPIRNTTEKAKCIPPALRAVLSNVEHRSSHYLNNGLECDHQHLKGGRDRCVTSSNCCEWIPSVAATR
jgi:transposase-like protein